MKKSGLLIISLLTLISCDHGFRNVIIPEPNLVEPLKGYYKVSKDNVIVEKTEDNVLDSPEGYELVITSDGVTIKAGTETGIFYARQSLRQLIDEYRNRIPAQHIIDAPRFGYRGVHLDVSRHFQDKEFVKKQLKMFASVKLNTFHFHLTDGIGWRLQLDSYPEMTEQTAYKHAGFNWYNQIPGFATADSPGAVGGFFTKDDIREIIAFADSLHITVIPEIEMFGHSTEVIHVFPELGCPVDTQGRSNADLCIGNEKTFEFLENVLAEVIELFPSEYIHIGGDEASMRNWAVCPLCQARMKKEGLSSVQELQSYGIARIEKFVNSKGRQIIGWEEIAKGGLAPNAALMSWRGVTEGQAAAATGHKVVFCPEPYCYLDAYQDAPYTQPNAIGNYVPARMTYSFDPADGEFEGKEFVWGVQGNLWTEYVEEKEHAEYMYYPRVFALAEVGWTLPENKDYDDWKERAIKFSDRAREAGYNTFDLREEIGPRPGSTEPLEHLAVGAEVIYNTPFTPSRRGIDEKSLTDGKCGSWVNKYGNWMTFAGTTADVTVDLGEVRSIKEVSAGFARFNSRSGILPLNVDFEGSKDGITYTSLASVPCDIEITKPENPYVFTYSWNGKTDVRYIRMVAHSGMTDEEVSDNQRRIQMNIDEIIVR